MQDPVLARLQEVQSLSNEERVSALNELADSVESEAAAALFGALAAEVVSSGEGSSVERHALGQALGKLGDPRLSLPKDSAYWVHVPGELGEVVVGRYPVTNMEYQRWVEAGGYQDQGPWSEEGWAWLQACEDPWPVNAAAEGSEPFIVANQPVVGVTFWEAEAYAKAHGARLPRTDERVWVVRGEERRPYPWGSPFGEGRANTREEVLGQPCAVGLFIGDRTPEGVADLAGNVAEWSADSVGAERLTHPGAWDQPSLASWAKALALTAPGSRSAGLGFRLALDS